jgi:SsrA-binding protein
MSKPQSPDTITVNKKAFHEYFIEEKFDAGLVLEGWEVKSLRAGRVNISDSYLILKNQAPWILGSHITPLPTAAKHTDPKPDRTRKLLLHAAQIRKLIGLVERKGYTLVPLRLYWKNQRVKLEFAVAKGKKLHDKRQAERDKSWEREKTKVLRAKNK